MIRPTRVAATAAAVAAASFITFAAGEAGGLRDRLDAMVAAERAFARSAAASGIRAAFLSYLAQQSVVFRPRPVGAREWYLDQKSIDGALSWEPELAAIARSGDLGYTTGPWEFRAKPSDKEPSASGHFVTIWQKQPNGSWLVALDAGVAHGPHARPVAAAREVTLKGIDQAPAGPPGAGPPGAGPPADDPEAERAALMNADRAFSNLSTFKGPIGAYRQYAAGDVAIYREGMEPAAGPEALRAAAPDRPALMTWRPMGAGLAASADLGYTFGVGETRPDPAQDKPDRFSYLRIWRRPADGEWKVILDLISPIPPS